MCSAVEQTEPRRAVAHTAREAAPGLFVGHGCAGRSGGEDHRRDLLLWNLRHVIRWRSAERSNRGAARLVLAELARIPEAGKVDVAASLVDQTEHIRRELRELSDEFRCVSGGQQTHF